MIEFIILGILAGSFFGIALILLRKMQVLVELPKMSKTSRSTLSSKVKEKVKTLPGAEKFDYELYLQKVLSRIRILTLKTESKTGGWLEKLRQKANQKNGLNNDNYWEKLKKTKRGK